MISISKNVCIDKSDDLVNKYNNTYHSTIKLRPGDVKSNTYIDSSKEINDEDPRFKIGDIVRISKYENIFAKVCTPNWSEEFFVLKKVRNTVPWTYVVSDINREKITGTFYAQNCKKQIKNSLELKK